MTNIDIPYSKTFLKSLKIQESGSPSFCPDDISGHLELTLVTI